MKETDYIKGKLEEGAGTVQDKIGKWSDDTDMQLEGKARSITGQMRQCCAKASSCLEKFTHKQPILALAGMGLVGALISRLLSRK